MPEEWGRFPEDHGADAEERLDQPDAHDGAGARRSAGVRRGVFPEGHQRAVSVYGAEAERAWCSGGGDRRVRRAPGEHRLCAE